MVRFPIKVPLSNGQSASKTPTVPPPTERLALTYGVELEFLVMCDPHWYSANLDQVVAGGFEHIADVPAPAILSKQVRQHMILILKEAGIPTNGLSGIEVDSWSVKTDPTIEPLGRSSHPPHWCDVGIEFTTPIFDYGDPTATAEILRFQNVLNAAFSGPLKGIASISTNQSCGVHVHVGSKGRKFVGGSVESLGFTLRTAKSVLQLAAAFERQLCSMHPLHRVLNFECAPLSLIPQFARFSTPQIVEWIEKTLTYEQVSLLGRGAVSMWQLCGMDSIRFRGKQKTIEFRMHAATMDMGRVIAWTDFVCGLIQACHKAGDAGFSVVFLKNGEEPDFDLHALMRALEIDNLDRLTAHYSCEKLYMHSWESIRGSRYCNYLHCDDADF